MATKTGKLHGRVEGAAKRCGVRGCGEAGEFRAPLSPGDFDGPGRWRWLCLDHVREHNAKYNFFEGMTPEEIQEAQSPIAGWERQSKIYSGQGSDPAPAWANFRDPLDAISARFRPGVARREMSRFSGEQRHALGILGLREDVDLHAVRSRYSELVRLYHPDRNGGDRSHERQLAEVIGAWQILKVARAFA